MAQSKKEQQQFEPVPQDKEVEALRQQMAEMQKMLNEQQKQVSSNAHSHPSQQQSQQQMQPQQIPQQQPTPQLSQLPALQGVSTYVAIHSNGLGVQTYLFDINLMQWRAPTQQESENMVQLFGIPKNVIDAMKNFRI